MARLTRMFFYAHAAKGKEKAGLQKRKVFLDTSKYVILRMTKKQFFYDANKGMGRFMMNDLLFWMKKMFGVKEYRS